MKIFGVVGYPIKHSLSPVMFNAVFKHLDMDAVYTRFEVKPEDFEDAMYGAKALGLTGLNITIPFKERAYEIFKADTLAEKIKAVNTIDLATSKAYNTDAYGAVKALKNKGVELKDSRILIVGAGGVARAMAFAFYDEKAEIFIANRTEERAKKLANEVGCNFIPLNKLTEVEPDIIVNATPLGMLGYESKLVVPESMIKADVVVFDTVYNPIDTPLIKIAKMRGCKIVYGYEMLVYQGEKAFEIWNGFSPPVDIMMDAVLKELTKSF